MAVTQAQWYAKLKSWVPTWFLQNEDVSKALFEACAEVLASAQNVSLQVFEGSFIETASGMYLDLHGSERSMERLEGESDTSYRARIKHIDNSTSYQTLYATIKGVLNNGEPILIENFYEGFADDDLFADTPEAVYLSKTRQVNRFTVIIPDQTVDDDTTLKKVIVAAIDEKKALGVFVDIVYETT